MKQQEISLLDTDTHFYHTLCKCEAQKKQESFVQPVNDYNNNAYTWFLKDGGGYCDCSNTLLKSIQTLQDIGIPE